MYLGTSILKGDFNYGRTLIKLIKQLVYVKLICKGV